MGVRTTLFWAWLLSSPAQAQHTAVSDARDLAALDDRILIASEGGLLVDGEPLPDLPGARMRSVSVTDHGVWAGGVEGTVLLDRDLRVVRRFALRRVRRAITFAGDTWLASFGDGLHRFDGERMRPVSIGTSHAHVRLTDLAVHRGELWVATSGVGIQRVGADGRVLGRLRERDGLPSDHVFDLAPHGDHLLAATFDGVAEIGTSVDRQSPIARASRRLPVRDVRAIAIADAIYLGTFGRGVFRIEGSAVRAVRGPMSQTNAMLATDEGLLVAHATGVHRVDGTAIYTGGLPSGDVTALERAFGTIWAGTFGHGLARLRNGRFEPVAEAHDRWRVDRRINDLEFAHGRLWIATDRGLHYHDGRIYSRVDDPNGPGTVHITATHADGDSLWVASTRQLCRMRSDRWRCWTGGPELPIAHLHAITTDAQHRVWVGSLHGLYRFDPARGTFERHTVSSGALPVDWVTALVPWGDGVIAGTYHGGLSIYDGRFRIVRESDGLPSGWVNPHAIRRIGGELYIGTLERGLVIGRPGAWRRLTTADGLPSDDVTDVLSDRDGVWVATRGGIVRLP